MGRASNMQAEKRSWVRAPLRVHNISGPYHNNCNNNNIDDDGDEVEDDDKTDAKLHN